MIEIAGSRVEESWAEWGVRDPSLPGVYLECDDRTEAEQIVLRNGGKLVTRHIYLTEWVEVS